jgi:hypothetical protein
MIVPYLLFLTEWTKSSRETVRKASEASIVRSHFKNRRCRDVSVHGSDELKSEWNKGFFGETVS